MIGRIRGEAIEIYGAVVVVDCGGVGYEVTVPESTLSQLPEVGRAVDLYVRQVFREDAVTLYGFTDKFQRRLFDLLTEVKGCGPKIALSILGQLGESTVVGAILSGDGRTMARATGVGPKLAERILLELKDKIAEEAALRRPDAMAIVETRMAPLDELAEVLIGLGYKRTDAERAAQETDDSEPLENRLKIALRSLAK